jgi:phenylacetate-CoA ligase
MNAPLSGHDQRFWAQALETQSRAQWEALKLGLLQAHLHHAYTNSPYYRASFDAAGVHPGQVKSLADLRHFPTIDKQVLRSRQEAVPILGDLAAVPERDVVYVSASSGSTGVPTVSPFTAQDFDDWIDFEARLFWSSGLRPTDRYAHSLNFSLFVGGPVPGRNGAKGRHRPAPQSGGQTHLRRRRTGRLHPRNAQPHRGSVGGQGL